MPAAKKPAEGDPFPDTTKVEEKLDNQGGGPVLVEAKDVQTLGFEDVDNSAAGGDQVQARVDEEEKFGQRGIKVDPTPNENYTVEGVTSGAPTPETDLESRAEAVSARQVDGPPAL